MKIGVRVILIFTIFFLYLLVGVTQLFSVAQEEPYRTFDDEEKNTYHTRSLNSDSELRLNISYPGNIPNFHDFNMPNVSAGSSGKIQFNVTNRYTFSNDNTMSVVSLSVNIYRYVTLDQSLDIQELTNSPEIIGGNDALKVITNPWTAQVQWLEIRALESVPVELTIKASADVPEGRYFIRMHLKFSFNGSYFDMKSRGHFSDAQWAQASEGIDGQQGAVDSKFIVGRIDLNPLGVDGIIPDTAMRIIKQDIPDFKQSTSEDDWLSTSVISLIIILVVVLLLIILFIIIYFHRKKEPFIRSTYFQQSLSQPMHPQQHLQQQYLCKECQQPLTFMQQYQNWYCNNCGRYM